MGEHRSGAPTARRRALAVVAATAALLAPLASCGGDDDAKAPSDSERSSTSTAAPATSAPSSTAPSTPAPPVEGEVAEVGAIDNTFRPGKLEVAAGTEVQWTNRGRNEHNVLPVDDDSWGVEASEFGPDATFRHRFTEPGTYHYYCSLHGTTTKGMVGVVVVTG